MDLLLIARKIWRYKLATLPIIIFVIAGAVYVVGVKEPVYEATSDYILINPPAPPTADELARNPSLRKVKSDNPYTRFSDQSVLVRVVASSMTSASERAALKQQGADERYSVGPTAEFGLSSPIIQIKGEGPSPEAAVQTARLVGAAVSRRVDVMQQAEGVDRRYRIKTYQVHAPDNAQLKASDTLRLLVGVVGLGIVLLFVVISVADALAVLKRERRTGGSPPNGSADRGPWLPGLGPDPDAIWPARSELSRSELERLATRRPSGD